MDKVNFSDLVNFDNSKIIATLNEIKDSYKQLADEAKAYAAVLNATAQKSTANNEKSAAEIESIAAEMLELKKAVDKGDRSVLHDIALPQAEEQPPGGHVPQLRIDPVGAPVQAGGNLRRIFEAGGHGEEQRGFPFGKQLLQDFDLDS